MNSDFPQWYQEFEQTHNMVEDMKEVKPVVYHTVHLRKFNEFEVSNTSGMTLCIHDNETFFAVAKAICSEKDQFCRKTGRNLAQHRMECGETDILYKSKVLNKLEHVIGMYRSLIDNGV